MRKHKNDMSISSPDTGLLLPSLSVTGFRGIEDLSIPRLGRVTLFAGKNGVGKTSVLEAIRLYAARGSYPALAEILRGREEFSADVDEDGDEVLRPDWSALFHGRGIPENKSIAIGPQDSGKHYEKLLRISIVSRLLKLAMQAGSPGAETLSDDDIQALVIHFGGQDVELPVADLAYPKPSYKRSGNNAFQSPSGVRCESVGPDLPDSSHAARLWDRVALTEAESRTVQALNLIAGDGVEVERIAVVGDERAPRRSRRRIIVKFKGQEHPVPLKSLGDGATRLFGVALALATSQDGFLVIDEAENGIHYSVQRDFWNMVLRTAGRNRVQVFATTHSWDCVAGFAQAAIALDDVEGTLIRLERSGNQIRAIEYSEDELGVAAEQRIEVR